MKKVLFVFILIPHIIWAQKDKEGSEDHPLVPRFKDAYIYFYEQFSYDPYTYITAKNAQISKEVEGKVTRIFYSLPTSSGSSYEIYSNYLQALKSRGASILFACKNTADCGSKMWENLRELDTKILMPPYYGEDLAYIAAKFSKDGIGYYITVIPGYGLGEQGYEVTVLETKEMEQQIDLEGIEKAMQDNGKVSLYGILFDTGSDKIEPESETEIKLIADYLKKNPKVKVYVVGHTDNTGSYENNLALSQRRAASVNASLQKVHGIAPDRLTAAGVGPVAPEAKNTTENGRKKNRRVEVVLNSF